MESFNKARAESNTFKKKQNINKTKAGSLKR